MVFGNLLNHVFSTLSGRLLAGMLLAFLLPLSALADDNAEGGGALSIISYPGQEEGEYVVTIYAEEISTFSPAIMYSVNGGDPLQMSEDGYFSVTSPATVTAWMVDAEGERVGSEATLKVLAFAQRSGTMTRGSNKYLPEVVPSLSDGEAFSRSYYSSDENVAIVDQLGLITAVGVGTATISMYNMASTTSNFFVPVEGEVLYEVTVEEGSQGYLLRVDGEQVTEDNRLSLLNGKAQFDGHSTLLLDNVTLSSIISGLDELNIVYRGDCTIEGYIRSSMGGQQAQNPDYFDSQSRLTIRMDADKPGTLTLGSYDNGKPVLSGFSSAELTAPLALLSASPISTTSLDDSSLTYAYIGLPLPPIVGETSTARRLVDIDYSKMSDSENLSNVIINDVLYTLNDTQTPGASDDGLYQHVVVLNSVMTDEDLDRALEYLPGTQDYALNFKGLTFMVPAGTGEITLKAMTQSGHALQVKIGNAKPVSIQTDGDYREVTVPYACITPTCVYIYHTVADAAARSPHRIGPKPAVSTGISGLAVKAVGLDIANAPSMNYKQLAKEDLGAPTGRGHIIVNDNSITDIASDTFDAYREMSGAPSRAASSSSEITYIDLTATSIVGKDYDRSSGAFDGIPANTFIYLPAGNFSTSENVIIGSVCPRMVLDDNIMGPFEVSKDFAAAEVQLKRSYAQDVKHPLCLPFELAQPEALGTFFEYESMIDNIVKMKKTLRPKANIPYFLQPVEGGVGGIFQQYAEVKAQALLVHNGLVGCYDWLDSYQSGTFAYDKTGNKFTDVSYFNPVLPFEAYLKSDGSHTEYLPWWEGEPRPTAVDALPVETDAQDAAWYTLSGQQMADSPRQKGVYLRQGKKIIVK